MNNSVASPASTASANNPASANSEPVQPLPTHRLVGPGKVALNARAFH